MRGGGEELSHDARIAAFASNILVVNPAIGFLQSDAEWSIRSPVKQLLNSHVVGIPAVYSFRRAQVVAALQLDASNLFGNVHQLVDGHGFAGAEIDRSRISEFMMRPIPFTQSSMYMKLRVCSPLPQISISYLPRSVESRLLGRLGKIVF